MYNQDYVVLGFGSYAMASFFRFSSVSIPAGATIVSAKLQLKSYNTNDISTVNVIVHLENSDNPAAPTSYSDAVGRSLTSGVAWNNVSGFVTDTWYDSPDITSIVQDVVDRAGWAENNAMIVFVKDNGSSASAMRLPKDRHSGASEGAKLVVTYTV